MDSMHPVYEPGTMLCRIHPYWRDKFLSSTVKMVLVYHAVQLSKHRPATSPDNGSSGTGFVNVFSGISDSVIDGVCYMGWATGLEPDVVSFLVDGNSSSDQCTEKNGCGSHMHEGPGCESKDAQGSHYYDRETIASDPWARESYYTTDNSGTAALIGCVITGDGASDYKSNAFILHDTAGDRMLCGLLE